MGNVALANGIAAAAQTLEDEEIREHIKHYVKGFNTLREHRNFYLHSLVGFVPIEDDLPEVQGILLSTQSRGKFRVIEGRLTVENAGTVFAKAPRVQYFWYGNRAGDFRKRGLDGAIP